MRKKLFFIYFIFHIFILLLFFINNFCFAADPQIIGKIDNAFTNIEKWILQIATPAAAVAVGSGIFMRKFSFGDEEKIRMGKKIIKGSLFSYAFILAIDLILSAIRSLIGG